MLTLFSSSSLTLDGGVQSQQETLTVVLMMVSPEDSRRTREDGGFSPPHRVQNPPPRLVSPNRHAFSCDEVKLVYCASVYTTTDS